MDQFYLREELEPLITAELELKYAGYFERERLQAEKMKREGMIENSRIYFNPWETIYEGNPQLILERREPVTLVPLLIMQGALDDNVLPALQEKFAATYRAAGGVCELTVFEGSEHEWVAKPSPQTDRAREMVKAFIARQLKA